MAIATLQIEVDPLEESYRRSDPDVRLMLRVQRDDREAFEELVLRYQHRLISVLDQIVGDRDLAEDLAQEVFLRVYRGRIRYRPRAKFATWLFTIANNVACNALRSKTRRQEIDLRPAPGYSYLQTMDGIACSPSATIPTSCLDQTEQVEIVQQAIGLLSERQRTALLLCKFEGLSYSEIAHTMGVTIQATKSLLARARENLRVMLEPYVEEGMPIGI